MLRMNGDSRAFAFVYVVAAICLLVICLVGLQVVNRYVDGPKTTNSNPQINYALYDAVENGQIVADSHDHVENGNIQNTFSLDNTIFPNVPSNYQLIYSGTAANDNSLITQDQSQLLEGAEVDYITNETVTNIHHDVTDMCSSHKFTFETTINNNTYIACQDNQTKWLFSILPAGDVLSEPWYKINSLNEITLANSILIQVISNTSPDIEM